MDTEKDLLVKIMQVTRKIQDNHPELCKFLSELPETISSDDNNEINVVSLKNYLESLNELMEKADQNKKLEE
jgi:hypothetical protein